MQILPFVYCRPPLDCVRFSENFSRNCPIKTVVHNFTNIRLGAKSELSLLWNFVPNQCLYPSVSMSYLVYSSMIIIFHYTPCQRELLHLFVGFLYAFCLFVCFFCFIHSLWFLFDVSFFFSFFRFPFSLKCSSYRFSILFNLLSLFINYYYSSLYVYNTSLLTKTNLVNT